MQPTTGGVLSWDGLAYHLLSNLMVLGAKKPSNVSCCPCKSKAATVHTVDFLLRIACVNDVYSFIC